MQENWHIVRGPKFEWSKPTCGRVHPGGGFVKGGNSCDRGFFAKVARRI